MPLDHRQSQSPDTINSFGWWPEVPSIPDNLGDRVTREAWGRICLATRGEGALGGRCPGAHPRSYLFEPTFSRMSPEEGPWAGMRVEGRVADGLGSGGGEGDELGEVQPPGSLGIRPREERLQGGGWLGGEEEVDPFL